MHKFQHLLSIIILLALSYWIVRPFTVSAFFPMHDDLQPVRIHVMTDALSNGQFPVRWVDNLGFGLGYPLFNFYAPLPYYIGGFINLIFNDVLVATKLMFLTGAIFAGIAMYFLVVEIAGSYAGIVAAIFYIYAPYHAVQIFVRGSIGELYSYAFLPLFLWGVYLIMKLKSGKVKFERTLSCCMEEKKALGISSLGLAGILLSHNITGFITLFFITLLFIILFIIVVIKRHMNRLFSIFCLAILLGIGLSAFFIVPAVMEKKYTRVDELIEGGSDFRKHFVYADQLWDSPWGYAGSAPGRADGMSFKVGKVHILIGLLSICFFIYCYAKRKLTTSQKYFFLLLYLVLISSLFFILPISASIWEVVPYFPFIQYPWRFLTFILVCLSILSASIFIPFGEKKQIIISIIIIFSIMWFNNKYFQPREYNNATEEDYINPELLSNRYSSVSYEYMPRDFLPPQGDQQESLSIFPDDGNIMTAIDKTPTLKKYHAIINTNATVLMDVAYYSGWQGKINNHDIELGNKGGRINLNLVKGEYDVELNFEGTSIQKVSNAISIFSIFLLIYVSLFQGNFRIWQIKKRLK